MDALGQLLEAVAPAVNEVVVVQVLVDDDVENGECQSGIGSGFELDNLLGTRTNPSHARIDRDELGSAFHEVDDDVSVESVGIGLQRLFAPNDNVFGKHVVGIVVEQRGVSAVVDFRIAAAHDEGVHGITGDVA